MASKVLVVEGKKIVTIPSYIFFYEVHFFSGLTYALLIIYYVSGLQHCIDQQEQEKRDNNSTINKDDELADDSYATNSWNLLKITDTASSSVGETKSSDRIERLVESEKDDLLSTASFEAGLVMSESQHAVEHTDGSGSEVSDKMTVAGHVNADGNDDNNGDVAKGCVEKEKRQPSVKIPPRTLPY